MSPKRLVVLVSCALMLPALCLLIVRKQHGTPAFAVQTLPKVVPELTTAQAQEILGAEFQVVRRVQQVPAAVEDDYAAVTHHRFWMVNSGEQVSTDAIIEGVPNKQLVLVGVAGQRAVLIFKEFGFTSYVHVLLFSHKDDVGVWGATLEDHTVKDIAGLRVALQKGQFVR